MYCIAVPEMESFSFQAPAKRTLSLRILQQAEMKRFLRLRMAEIQPVGAETDLLPGASLFAGRVILGVADDGAAYVCKLYPDLVMPSGIQPDIQFGGAGVLGGRRSIRGEISLSGCNNLIVQPGKFGFAGIRAADAGQIGAGIFCHVIFQCIFFLRRVSGGQRPVILAEFMAG